MSENVVKSIQLKIKIKERRLVQTLEAAFESYSLILPKS